MNKSLRDKEQSLRRMELSLIEREGLTDDDFEKELQKFWDINRDIISTNFNFEFPKDSVAKNLKSSYSLLLHNRPGDGQAHLFKNGQEFKWVHIDPVTIIVGTTGAGKTRAIFEYLCSNYGFYFLAENDNYSNYGSKDLTKFFGELESIGCHDKNTGFVQRYMNCALASRMHLLLQLKKRVGFTPKKWLLVQIMVTKETDYLNYLTEIFRKARDSYLVNLWAEFRKEFKCSERKMLVYIDEAQVLLPQFEDYFPGTDKKRPLYTAVVKSVMKGNVREEWNN